jgi:cardiolipin synthase
LVLAVALMIIASDTIDGMLARRLKQVTACGRVLDPVVDKIVLGTLLILLYLHRSLPLWAVLVVVFRDMLMLGTVCTLIWLHKQIPAPRYWGSLPNALLGTAGLLYVFGADAAGLILLIVALAFNVLQLADYAARIR